MKFKIYFLVLLNCNIFINITLGQNISIEKKLDNYINLLPDKFSGTILIAIGDKILINKGYGMANIECNISNKSNTKYEIGSVTKHFTAILTLKMAEKGLVDLNATIDKYLPDYPKEFASKITIHHLLMHQSGIGQHYNIIPEYFDGQDKKFHTQQEYLQLFWDKKLAHEPGQGYTYSSPGYYLLAVILEKVAKKSYAELLQEYIFNPLDMNSSSVANNLTIIKDKATGYKKGISGLVNNRNEEESNCLGAGDIISTTTDLYKFQKIFTPKADSILTKEYKDLLIKPQTPTFTGYDGNKIFLSYSAEISPVSYNDGKETLNIIWDKSEGSSYGYRARVTRFMEKDACYVVLSNIQTDRSMTTDMYNYIEDLLFENLNINIKKVKNTDTWDAISYKSKIPFNSYEGFYKISNNSFIQVIVDNNILTSRSFQSGNGFDNVAQNELIPERENIFRVKGQEGLRYFFTKDSLNRNYVIIQKDTAKIIINNTNQDLLDYTGIYYSVELQKSFNFEVKGNNLITGNFLNKDNVVFVPLEIDLFGCKYGFLIFHRYPDGKIRDFKFSNESLDALFGSTFIKE
jgi:CubicO group peptidase (beta-lactamase class C family)